MTLLPQVFGAKSGAKSVIDPWGAMISKGRGATISNGVSKGEVQRIPSSVGTMHFSVPTSAQKLCEHFQKCAISPVEDRPESS